MTKDEALQLALEALGSNRRTHHYCEDTWYSCPKHEDGCANDSEGDECNCGADKVNAGIDQAIIAIKEALETKEGLLDRNSYLLGLYDQKSRLELETKDEPVAWEQFHEHMAGPNYVAPQRTWVGLTDEEIRECFAHVEGVTVSDAVILISVVRTTQASLKEKNT